MDSGAALVALRWLFEAGADEAIGDQPVARYGLTAPAASPPPPTIAPPSAPPRLVPAGGDTALDDPETARNSARALAQGCRV